MDDQLSLDHIRVNTIKSMNIIGNVFFKLLLTNISANFIFSFLIRLE